MRRVILRAIYVSREWSILLKKYLSLGWFVFLESVCEFGHYYLDTRSFGLFENGLTFIQVPDYYDIIKNPMDLSTMMTRIDLHKYETVAQFLLDIDLICSNALEYNPDKDPQGIFHSFTYFHCHV